MNGSRTCVVDERVDSWVGRLDGGKGGIDGLVAGEIHLHDLEGVGRGRDLVLDFFHGSSAVFERSAGEDNVVGFGRLVEGLDNLVANAAVGTSDEDDGRGRHVESCSVFLGKGGR